MVCWRFVAAVAVALGVSACSPVPSRPTQARRRALTTVVIRKLRLARVSSVLAVANDIRRQSDRRSLPAWLAGTTLTIVLVTGCAGPRDQSGPAVDMVTPLAAPSPTLSAEDLAAAIQLRTKYGLRADEAWIRLMAKDPSAGTLLGVPLSKAEEAVVAQRIAPAEVVARTVRDYAISQPDYAGVTSDWGGDGVVAYFAGDAEQHREALIKLLPPGARFELVRVQYTRAELLTLSRQVDAAWLESIGAKFTSSGVDTKRNQVRVRVSSSVPLVGEAIIAHYNAVGRMYVESDGVGAAFLPTGTLVVIAADEHGRPVSGLLVSYTGDLPGTGSGDVGEVTDGAGRWQAEVTATRYHIELMAAGRVVGTAVSNVGNGEVTTIRIVIRNI